MPCECSDRLEFGCLNLLAGFASCVSNFGDFDIFRWTEGLSVPSWAEKSFLLPNLNKPFQNPLDYLSNTLSQSWNGCFSYPVKRWCFGNTWLTSFSYSSSYSVAPPALYGSVYISSVSPLTLSCFCFQFVTHLFPSLVDQHNSRAKEVQNITTLFILKCSLDSHCYRC